MVRGLWSCCIPGSGDISRLFPISFIGNSASVKRWTAAPAVREILLSILPKLALLLGRAMAGDTEFPQNRPNVPLKKNESGGRNRFVNKG